MDRIIKNYENFLNEGKITDFIKKSFNDIIKYFVKLFGAGGNFKAGLYMYQKGYFKKWDIKGIAIYDFSNNKNEKLPNVMESLDYELYEKVVNLKHEDPSVRNLKPKELMQRIILSYTTKDSLLIWGAPGVGKSQIVKKATEKLGIRLIDLRLAYREPTDFIGMPVTNHETRTTEFYLPGIFPREGDKDDRGGIIFLDEINRAPIPVLNASLQLTLDRKLDEYILPKKWMCIAAANRENTGEAPAVTPLEPALLNRFDQVNLYMEAEDWVDWAFDARVSEDDANIVLPQGEKYIPEEVLGFLLFRKEYLHKYDPDPSSGEPTLIWPSPRSWDKACRQLETAKRLAKREGRELSDPELLNVMSDSLGVEAATMFVEYVQLTRNIPNLEDLKYAYTQPKKAPLPPEDKPAISHAMIVAVGISKRGEKITVDNLYNIMEYAKRFKTKELATPLINFVVKDHPEVKEDPRFLNDFLRDWYVAFPRDANF